jgi:hypothetical protein
MLPAPRWRVDTELAEWMRRLIETEREPEGPRLPEVDVLPSPPWPDLVKRSLPVRGPSLVA